MRVQLYFALASALAVMGEARAAPASQPLPATAQAADSMAIARVLYADGFFERAQAVLEDVRADEPGVDPGEYWLLRGLVELKMQRFSHAADYLLACITRGDPAAKVYLLRAQALIGAGQYSEAARSLKAAPVPVWEFPQAYLLVAHGLYKLEDRHGAFVVLNDGRNAFPDDPAIERQRLLLLMDLGLYQQAQDAATAFFATYPSKPQDHIALAEVLRKGGQLQRAQQLLEEAALRFPQDEGLRTQLAVTYLDLGHPTVAAEVLRPLAWLNPERVMHTAELYRKGAAYGRATRMNQRVEDQKSKFRQRLGLLLEQEQYELAASLYPRIARLGLMQEQSIVYAMAYALFMTHDFDGAERLLGQLSDEKLFRQGVVIRRKIEDCRRAAWQCD